MTIRASGARARLMMLSELTAALTAAIVLTGCDPGYRYRPEGWKVVGQSTALWSTSIGDVILEHGGIGGLTINKDIGPEFEIRNRSRHSFVLERAELVTPGGRQPGKFLTGAVDDVRTVKPGATRRVPVFWDFSQPANEVLGANPQIVLEYRLNNEPGRLVITYERVG